MLLLVLLLASSVIRADIGETYELQHERQRVLNRIEFLERDTTRDRSAEVDQLRLSLISLDERIFQSYDQTVERLSGQKLERSLNDRMIVYLAFLTAIAAIFFAILVVLARNRMVKDEEMGVLETYRILSVDFLSRVTGQKAGAAQMLKVNLVVVIGLILMSISIISFLFSAL